MFLKEEILGEFGNGPFPVADEEPSVGYLLACEYPGVDGRVELPGRFGPGDRGGA